MACHEQKRNGQAGDTGAATANAIEYAKRTITPLRVCARSPFRNAVNQPIATIARHGCTAAHWSTAARVVPLFRTAKPSSPRMLQRIYKANTVVLIEKLIRSISRCICNLRFSLDSRVPMNAKEEFRGKNEKRRGYRFSKNLNNIDLKVFLSWRRSVAKNGRGGRDGVV